MSELLAGNVSPAIETSITRVTYSKVMMGLLYQNERSFKRESHLSRRWQLQLQIFRCNETKICDV